MEDEVPLEVQNSLRLAHQALSEKGRKNVQDASALEAFYERVWQIALPHKSFKKLQKPGIEAFYCGNMDKDGFVALFRKNVLVEGYVQDVSALTELCFNTFLSVDSREQQLEKYIPKHAARQLWQVFAKLDRFGCLGLPNEEVNELLLRVAALSQLETLTSEMARVATMELVDFWQFMEILIVQVFQKFNKQFCQKMIQDLHDDIVHELLKKGMLKKRGHVRKNWKDRFFVLAVRSLTYFESQTNLTKKGQLTINQSSGVMLVTEAGKPTECSTRFRVTCGSTGTATDIVAEDCDVAMEWVKAIQVAIAFHQVNEKQSRNFLHQLTLARKRVKGTAVAVHEEPLMSPVAGDTQFTFPAASSPVDYRNGSSPSLSRGQKSSEMKKPHEYEDVDKVADICTQVMSQSPSSTGKRTLSTSKSTPVVHDEVEYTVVQKKKASQPAMVVDEELPPPVPKRAGAKSSDDPMMYVDLRFSSGGPFVLPESPGTKKQQKKDHAVEYTDVNTIAMALASPTVDDVTRGSKDRKTSVEQPDSGSNMKTKPMMDVTHEKHSPRKPSADGDYINITYDEKVSAGSSKKMVDVTAVPKRQASKDGDYVGVSYDAGGKCVAQSHGRVSDHTVESARPADQDYINLVAVSEVVQATTSKPMVDVTDERPLKKQSGDGNYVDLAYHGTSPAPHFKDSDDSRRRGAPPSIPVVSSPDDDYVTVQAPDGAPQPKPRKNIPRRPASMLESGSKSEALGVNEGQKYSRALTPSPDLGTEARKHDYVLLLPDAPTAASEGKPKIPPAVPRPYHETHAYVNTSRPLSYQVKPALPPKSQD